MLKKWNMRLIEPWHSSVLAGLLGGVLPAFSFMYILWVDDKYPADAQFYFPSPFAIPGCCLFSITSFPAMILFFAIGTIQKSYGNPTIIDALDPRTQISIYFALCIFFNICVHWVFWRFIWRAKKKTIEIFDGI